MIDIVLETLDNGLLRATGRNDGRTIEYFEGQERDARVIIAKALKASAPAHALPSGGYDMTYIRLNDAAAAVLYPRDRAVQLA